MTWPNHFFYLTVLLLLLSLSLSKTYTVCTAEPKDENPLFETESSIEASQPNETEGNDSEPKQELEQDENDDGGSGAIFTYEQLKAKSDNPVTGIDFKRREVSVAINSLNMDRFPPSRFPIELSYSLYAILFRPICAMKSFRLCSG